jgi:Mg2+ and Co2+ transporter CorA
VRALPQQEALFRDEQESGRRRADAAHVTDLALILRKRAGQGAVRVRTLCVAREKTKVVDQTDGDPSLPVARDREGHLFVRKFVQFPPRAVVRHQTVQIAEVQNSARVLRDVEHLRPRLMRFRRVDGDQRKATLRRAGRESQHGPKAQHSPRQSRATGTADHQQDLTDDNTVPRPWPVARRRDFFKPTMYVRTFAA